MNAEAKKQVLRSLVYGVYVLGVEDAEAPRGVHLTTVAWVMQVSFEPPMVSIGLHRESRALALVLRRKAFSLGILPASARAVASKLGRSSAEVRDKSASVALLDRANGPSSSPMLEAVTGWVECEVDAHLETGDHMLLTARVVGAGVVGSGATLTLAETGWRYSG
jgi:flavin reductase (DIM6/NTAB) family NADH-FMN oxidoreductase RutF